MINKEYKLKSNNIIPKFGIGTWCLGEIESKKEEEIESVAYALENGVRLIDTAEMYGEGGSEIVIGEALKRVDIERKDLYIVSKVYPYNSGKDNFFNSLHNSLKRLNINYLDLYLLHWKGRIPLSETIECMEIAKKEGLIKDWGVSNFDIEDMQELSYIKDGDKCAVNQVLYHLGSRGIDYSLAPYLKKENIAIMAYCPLGRAGELGEDILKNDLIIRIAKKHNASPAQIALTFILEFENRIVIPKSFSKEHTLENINSINIELDEDDFILINREFPKPTRKMCLDIL